MNSRERWLLAIALAVAIHEVLFGIVGRSRLAPVHEEPAPIARMTIERRPPPTPRPTPRPQPLRTPRPVPTPKPVPTPVHPTPTPPPVPTPPPAATAAPVAHAPSARHASTVRHAESGGGGGAAATFAAARRAGHHSLALGTGSGMNGGSGSGSNGGTGNGNGGGNGSGGLGTGGLASAPCGVVDFDLFKPNHWFGDHFEEYVQAKVTFRDGHQEDARFPYPWTYHGDDDDPWSTQNTKKQQFYIPAQLPPPGFDTAQLQPVMRYILAHTSRQGFTDLPPCPKTPQ